MWILGGVLGYVFVIAACLAIFLPLYVWGVYDIPESGFLHTWPLIISYFFFLILWIYLWGKFTSKQTKDK